MSKLMVEKEALPANLNAGQMAAFYEVHVQRRWIVRALASKSGKAKTPASGQEC